VKELCRLVGECEGRPIVTSAMSLAVIGVSGLWLRGRTTDYVCYEQDTSVTHQTHIILHELGHIVFGHRGLTREFEDLFTHLNDATLKMMLSRRHAEFSSRQEAEAETFAYVAGGRIKDPFAAVQERQEPFDRIRRLLET